MNRAQMRARLKTYLAIPPAGDGLMTDDRLNATLDDALARVASVAPWPHLLTSGALTFATDGTATLPTNFMRAKRDGLIINSAPVHYVGLTDFLATTDRPWSYVWTITGTTARIDPAPSVSTAATLWYYRSEVAMTLDTSTPLMPEVNHHVLCAFAAHLGWLSRGDATKAQIWYSEYENAVNQMRDDQRSESGPGQIRTKRTVQYAVWS